VSPSIGSIERRGEARGGTHSPLWDKVSSDREKSIGSYPPPLTK